MAEQEKYRQVAANAIRQLRNQIRWKPNKDVQHLAKRKAKGHLPAKATLDNYNAVIRTVLSAANSAVYRYPFGVRDYYAVSGEVKGMAWLVIFSADGVIETAFPPDNLSDYLNKRGFEMLGRMEEIVYE